MEVNIIMLILDWQINFLESSQSFLREFSLMLESDNGEIMDNVSVVLSKLANGHCSDLQANSKLWTRILQLSSAKANCFGGGGDISTDGMNLGVSEFLLLNLNFILRYANHRVPLNST